MGTIAHARTATLALALLAGACGCADRRAPPAAAPPLQVHTELIGLAAWIDLPPGATATRWVVRTQGVADPRTPGPTDTILSAYIAIDATAWPSVERKLGASTRRGTLSVNEAVAHAILPDRGAGAAQTSLGAAFLVGAEYSLARLAHPSNADATAVRWRDGLVFELYSH